MTVVVESTVGEPPALFASFSVNVVVELAFGQAAFGVNSACQPVASWPRTDIAIDAMPYS
jgi:hypothetical protein